MVIRKVKCVSAVFIALCVVLFAAPLAAQQLEYWNYCGFQDQSVNPITVATGDSNLILVGGSRLYISRDGAQTWNPDPDPNMASVWCITFGSNKYVAFVVANGALYKSTDGCNTWVRKGSGVLPGLNWVTVDPTNDSVVYAGAYNGVWESVDGGETWVTIASGFEARRIDVARSNPSVIYVGGGNGEWKSTNGGMTWTKLPCPVPEYAPMNGIKVDPADENIVYGIWQINGGAWVSRDGGQTWTNIQPGIEGFTIAVDVNRPGFVYAVGGWTTPKRSPDCGATGWHDMTAGYTAGFATAIAVDPNDSSKIYVAGHRGMQRWIADITPPNPPSGLTAQTIPNGIKLSWTKSNSSDCAGYLIFRKEQGGSYGIAPYAELPYASADTFTDVQITGGTTYTYKVCAFDGGLNRSTFTNEASATAVSSIDLDVTYIERTPQDCRMYRVDYPESIPILVPGTENDKRWPEYGETVTWVAHFINHGSVASPPANYRWKINGEVVATGTAPGLAPGQEGTASLPWQWNVQGIDTDHSDQTISFEIDYDNQVAESFEQNNVLTDFLEGVSLWFYVEPALYDALNRRENLVGTYSAEDWVQAQIKAMNDLFARSTYPPLAPNGALERFRVDRLIVGYMPGPDYIADGRWMVSGGDSYAQGYAKGVDNGLIHELMHQLGIIDLYMVRITAGFNQVITPDGIPNGTDWFWGRPGIMGGGDIAPVWTSTPHAPGPIPDWVDWHSVMALNKNCGYKRGYYGEYMFDIPLYNYVLVKDAAGNPVPNATIKVYMMSGSYIPKDPVSVCTTDQYGKALLPNRPIGNKPFDWTITTATGHTQHANPFGLIGVAGLNALLLLEVSRPGGDFDYRYIDITEFNRAFWLGNEFSWTYTWNSRLASSKTLQRITTLNGAVESSKVVLKWPAVPGAVSYRVYKASAYRNNPDDPTHQYENWVYRPIASTTSLTYTDTALTEPSRYAVTARDAAGREAPLSNRLFAPLLVNPWGVGIKADNSRVILDPQNGYALMNQDGEGRYIANFGSVHYHLERSRFMAIDKDAGRLIISHPTSDYSDYHSIRVADLEANPLYEIGTVAGSAPGQFNNPTGVAVDADGTIYAVDSGNSRIQIFYRGAMYPAVMFGEAGSGPGQFNNPMGIAVDSNYRIYICDYGNRRVQVFQFNGFEVQYLGVLPKTFTGPMGVAVGSDGKIYVTDYDAHKVESFTPYWSWIRSYEFPTDIYTGHLLRPTGIAVDNNGVLVVCDTGNRRVVSITPMASTTTDAARLMPNNSTVLLEGVPVTAAFSGYFYIQSPGHLPGIRVVSNTPVTVGQMVDVYGSVKTVNGEREIQPVSCSAHAMAPVQPKPAGMNIRTLGGGPQGPVPGITGMVGLNNIGLLVKVAGRTSGRNAGASEFYLDDGSPSKIRVYAPNITLPNDGSMVVVEGISGAEVVGGQTVRVLRARSVKPL